MQLATSAKSVAIESMAIERVLNEHSPDETQAIPATPVSDGHSWVDAAIFAAALIWAIGYLVHTGLIYDLPTAEEKDIAVHLAKGEGFRSPFDDAPSATFTSWSPPVYPYLMSVVFRLAGIESRASSVILEVINAIAFATAVLGIFKLGTILFWPAVGWISALLLMCHPMYLRWIGLLWDQEIALAMFILLAVMAVSLSRDRFRMSRFIMLGIGIGVLCLTNASYVLTIPVLIWISSRGNAQRQVRSILITTAAVCLTLAPWTIRNELVFHRLYFVRGGGSFELYFGNRPEMTGWIRRDLFDAHPAGNEKEQDLILADEAGYFDLCARRFDGQRHHDPTAFTWRCVYRLGYLFLSDPTEKENYALMPNLLWRGYVVDRVLVNGLLTIFGLSGIFMAIRLNYRGLWLQTLLLAVGGPFVVAHVWDRYTLPFRAMLLVGAGFTFATVVRVWRTGAWPTAPDHKSF